jgi:N-acetyl-gamma-glutamyl-phosphate reductase
LGATGYAGVEAVRLLLEHPNARPVYLASHSHVGQRFAAVYPHLAPFTDAVLGPMDADRVGDVDIALVSLPSRESLTLVPELVARGMRVVDFSADFRLRSAAEYRTFYGIEHTQSALLEQAVYGLPEMRRNEIRNAVLVANPGCYPTAAILALGPALSAGLVLPTDIIVDAYSGVSGAGREPSRTTHLAEMDGSLVPYSVAGAHRHTPEIAQELSRAAAHPVTLTFSPHLAPQARGILTTCYARLARSVSQADVEEVYRQAYHQEPFVWLVVDGLPNTKAVAGTNMAQIAVRVDRSAERLVAMAAIDNLGKGASGQAVQNMNLMLGINETAGLPRIAMWP